MDYVKNLRKLVGHRPLILTGSVVLILNQFPYSTNRYNNGTMNCHCGNTRGSSFKTIFFLWLKFNKNLLE